MSALAISSFGPRRPWVRPGASVPVDVEVSAAAAAAAAAAVSAELSLQLLDLDVVVGEVRQHVTVGPGSTRHTVRLELPLAPRHGYGLKARVSASGSSATASSAVEALDGWWQSPRHAAITDYGVAEASAEAARGLIDWHVTVAQHYDWMWRHYRYRPPHGAAAFKDALGRAVSHPAVSAAIEAGHEVGIASLAYGSVYGAEPEYVERHPDERVFDEEGRPISLGDTFFINDVRPASPWRQRLLREYEDAVTSFDFDGIHMDTYGPPHRAMAADGEVIDFAELYPGLIEEAAQRVAASRSGGRVLFNCVEGFPLDAVASAPTACLYLELWPPDRAFSDVVRWIDHARALADGRQVIVAAYAASLRDEVPAGDRAEAVETVTLLGAVITAAGAYHHTLAAGDRLLVEGYYPAAVTLHPAEVRELQALWAFSARYVQVLSDPGLEATLPGDLRIEEADGDAVAWSSEPTAGSIWVRTARMPDGRRVLHLIDLLSQADDYWDEPKRRASRRDGLRLWWDGLRRPVAASPWHRRGDAEPLRRDGDGWVLPPLCRWSMVVEGLPAASA